MIAQTNTQSLRAALVGYVALAVFWPLWILILNTLLGLIFMNGTVENTPIDTIVLFTIYALVAAAPSFGLGRVLKRLHAVAHVWVVPVVLTCILVVFLLRAGQPSDVETWLALLDNLSVVVPAAVGFCVGSAVEARSDSASAKH